jgi:hypothetical protein
VCGHRPGETLYRCPDGGKLSANGSQWYCFTHGLGGYLDHGSGPPMPDLSWRATHPISGKAVLGFPETVPDDWLGEGWGGHRSEDQTAFACYRAGWSAEATRAHLSTLFAENVDEAVERMGRSWYGAVIQNKHIQRVIEAQTHVAHLERHQRDLLNLLLSQAIAVNRTEEIKLSVGWICTALEWLSPARRVDHLAAVRMRRRLPALSCPISQAPTRSI